MAAVAQTARAEAPAAPSAARARVQPAHRPRVASGVVWIAVVAALLAGVVAMNVAVLRANVALDELGRERTRLRAETAALSSELSSAQAAARIQALARKELGLVQARAAETTYIDLAP